MELLLQWFSSQAGPAAASVVRVVPQHWLDALCTVRYATRGRLLQFCLRCHFGGWGAPDSHCHPESEMCYFYNVPSYGSLVAAEADRFVHSFHRVAWTRPECAKLNWNCICMVPRARGDRNPSVWSGARGRRRRIRRCANFPSSPTKRKEEEWDEPTKRKGEEWDESTKRKDEEWDEPTKRKEEEWDELTKRKGEKVEKWDERTKRKEEEWDDPQAKTHLMTVIDAGEFTGVRKLMLLTRKSQGRNLSGCTSWARPGSEMRGSQLPRQKPIWSRFRRDDLKHSQVPRQDRNPFEVFDSAEMTSNSHFPRQKAIWCIWFRSGRSIISSWFQGRSKNPSIWCTVFSNLMTGRRSWRIRLDY